MGLRTFTPAPKGNKYSADLQTLLEATNQNTDPANVPAWDLEVPTAKADYERGEFQRAANFIKKTAKVVASEVQGDNTVITFILVDMYAGKKKSETEVAAEAAPEVTEVQETPAEAPADETARPKSRR